MPRAKPGEYTKFHLFWNWEYAKRNDPEDAKRTIEIFANLEVRDVYKDSSQLLDAILCSSFKYVYYTSSIEHSDSVKLIYREHSWQNSEMRYKFDKLRRELDNCGFSADNDFIQPCIIDFSKPLSQVIADIKSEYTAHHCKNKHGVIYGNIIHEQSLEEQIRSASAIRKLPKQGHRNLPRAIGLWLWDYLMDRGFGMSRFAKARNAFYATYQDENSKLRVNGYNDESQLKSLMLATDKCIREKSVLPLA